MGEREAGTGGWWACLWATLTLVSLCLGVAALWLPLDRHLQIEERLEEVERRQEEARTFLEMVKTNMSHIQVCLFSS